MVMRNQQPHAMTLNTSLNTMVCTITLSHASNLLQPNYDRVNVEAFEAHSAIVASIASSSDEGHALVNMI